VFQNFSKQRLTLLSFLAKFGLALLFFFFLAFQVLASGKMEVPLGGRVILEAESLTVGKDYKWVVTKEGVILNTQAGNVFSYTFDQQGEHVINLAVEDPFGISQNTTVQVMVGGRYSAPVEGGSGTVFDIPLQADLSTLPSADANGVVRVLGDEGRVVFDIAPRADVLEYRLDRNIYVDSDQNGIPNDDIDNEADPSYLLGGLWQTTYSQTESTQLAAALTVVNTSGKTSTTDVEIGFGPFDSGGELLAILDTLPPRRSNDGKIYVYEDQNEVAFYTRRSEGQILEYRIDANINVDSDGDGVADNDIDNQNDDSFETGDVWMTTYQNTGEPITAQLIVVGAGGKGSRIQREVVFISRSDTDSETPSDATIVLNADKSFVLKGDPISFSVDGLAYSLDNYNFEWDFNGDAEIDQVTEGQNSVTYIFDSPGLKQVSVRVQDQDGNRASFTKEIQVQDLQVTGANFEFTVDGKTVQFQNNSTVSAELESQNLSYTWSFGDTDEDNYAAQNDQIGVENPRYSYLEAGTYSVSLTVTDASGDSDTSVMDVVIEGLGGGGEVEQGGEKSGSIFGTVFKVILYLLLGIVVLILLGLVGMLIFLKLQHPDLVFEELVDELKMKILKLLGMQDALEDDYEMDSSPADKTAMTGGKIPPYHPKNKPIEPLKPKEEIKPEPKKEPSVTPEVSPGSNAPTPDWLKKDTVPSNSTSKKEVIEAESEVVSSTPVAPKKPEAPRPPVSESSGSADFSQKPDEAKGEDLSQGDGPVPEWLKKN